MVTPDPRSRGAAAGDRAPPAASPADGALGPVETFLDLIDELNRQLTQLEYALFDLKEALVQCDRGELGKLEQQAARHLDRIRRSARENPGFPPLDG
jgi:hypothetical protein